MKYSVKSWTLSDFLSLHKKERYLVYCILKAFKSYFKSKCKTLDFVRFLDLYIKKGGIQYTVFLKSLSLRRVSVKPWILSDFWTFT